MDNSKIEEIISVSLQDGAFIEALFCQPCIGEKSKSSIRPVEIRGERKYQVSETKGNKVFHTNLSDEAFLQYFIENARFYKQIIIHTQSNDYHLLMNRRKEQKMVVRRATKSCGKLSHNRSKKHVFSEDQFFPFLHALGITDERGKVIARMHDKHKQINAFLDNITKLLEPLLQQEKIVLVDFGCGKAYLTFALYHYLRVTCEKKVAVYGVDLKADMVQFCNQVASNLGYESLHFIVQSIESYEAIEPIDIVVALHACNTSTDAVLKKAIDFEAKLIIVAPCCQHELMSQIDSEALCSLTRHGILKERFAALATDALRAERLTESGYSADIIEFIDSEHTPKNVMIRAVKGNKPTQRAAAKERSKKLEALLNIHSD